MSEETINNANNTTNHDDEHEYDGIKELNNPAPYWVVLLFLVTIVFSGIYAIKYFGYPDNGMDQDSEYITSAEQDNNTKSKGGSGKSLSQKEMIADGEKLFAEKGCVACHGVKGEGNAVGPNLCDNMWLNGCSIEDVTKIISEGKPEKGMTAFKSTLSETQILHVSTYIVHSLVASNPANAKAPQGVECK